VCVRVSWRYVSLSLFLSLYLPLALSLSLSLSRSLSLYLSLSLSLSLPLSLPLSLSQKTPAESREHNRDCILLSFFDDHDIWHFLSSIAMFGSFLVRSHAHHETGIYANAATLNYPPPPSLCPPPRSS